MNLGGLRNRLLLSLLLGVIVFAGLTFYADYQDVGESLSDFRWELLPLILVLTTMNYVFRFVKWEYYLGIIGVKGLSKWDSILIFSSGLGMVITPGKVGEWLKSYLLREVHGTPIARSAPILIAERLTDSIALLIMASVGLFVFGELWAVAVFAFVAAGVLAFIVVSRHRPAAYFVLGMMGKVPFVRRFTPQLEEFYESTYALLSPRAVIAMAGLSTVSWFFEVLGFYFTLIGVGLDASGELLLQSAFILPISTLASAILFTPGGLGVAEAAITALSQSLLDISASAAAVATFIIRFATLWFGVIIGLIAFAILSRRLSLDADTVLVASDADGAPASAESMPEGPP